MQDYQEYNSDDMEQNPDIASTILGLFLMAGAGYFFLTIMKATKDAKDAKDAKTGLDKPPKNYTPGVGYTPGTTRTISMKWNAYTPFPSAQEGVGVSYDDVYNAFSYVRQLGIQVARQIGDPRDWPTAQEPDPVQTISSIARFRDDNFIPASAASPSMYVNQFNHSVAILNSLSTNPAAASQLMRYQ